MSSNVPNKNYSTRKTSTVHGPHLNQIYIVAWWWLSHLLNIYLRGGRRFFPPLMGSDGERSISTILLKDRDCEQSNKNLDKCWTQLFRSASKQKHVKLYFFSPFRLLMALWMFFMFGNRAIPHLFERLILISWQNNRDCHKTMLLSLKTMEVQIERDEWKKRFRTVQVYCEIRLQKLLLGDQCTLCRSVITIED